MVQNGALVAVGTLIIARTRTATGSEPITTRTSNHGGTRNGGGAMRPEFSSLAAEAGASAVLIGMTALILVVALVLGLAV
jgi:hypothetical protein